MVGIVRNEPNPNDLKRSENTLEERGKTPAPSVVDILSRGISDPSRYKLAMKYQCILTNNVADKPRGIVQSGEPSAVLRMGQLGDEKGCATLGNLNTHTDEEASGGEHANVLRGSLESNGDQTNVSDATTKDIHDNGADNDTPASTESIGEEGEDGHCADGTDGVDGVEETEGSTGRMAKVVLPIGDRLQRVHHGAIVPGGGRGGEDDQKKLNDQRRSPTGEIRDRA